jgi:hypothetical protein
MFLTLVNHGMIIMKKTSLLVLCAIAVSFGIFACSDDSSTEASASGSGALVDGSASEKMIEKTERAEPVIGLSTDFKILKDCSEYEDLQSAEIEMMNDTTEKGVSFYMNEDGSATVTRTVGGCKINAIAYELRNDTLYMKTKYVDKADCSLSTDSTQLCVQGMQFRCSCLYMLEIRIPTEFVGAKYLFVSNDKIPAIEYVDK